MKLQTVTVMAC